ncbi:hypothetical protein D3C76_1440420 [compost metagenome]
MTDSAQRAAFVGGHHPLRGIFHHIQVVLFRQRHDGVHLARHAGIVYRHDGAGLVGDRRFNQRLVDVHGVRTDIHEDDFRSTQHEGVSGRDKGVARHDHFIARTDIQQ